MHDSQVCMYVCVNVQVCVLMCMRTINQENLNWLMVSYHLLQLCASAVGEPGCGTAILLLSYSIYRSTYLSLSEHFRHQHFCLNWNQWYCLKREKDLVFGRVRRLGWNYSYNVFYATAKFSIFIITGFWIWNKFYVILLFADNINNQC